MHEFAAWADESGSNQELDPGAYLLCAIILPPTDIDSARQVMSTLLLPGQRKVHWWRESDKRRDEIAQQFPR